MMHAHARTTFGGARALRPAAAAAADAAADVSRTLAGALERAKAMGADSLYISGSPTRPSLGFRSGWAIAYQPIPMPLAEALLERFGVRGPGLSDGLLVNNGRFYRWYCMPTVEGADGYAPLVAVHRPALQPAQLAALDRSVRRVTV